MKLTWPRIIVGIYICVILVSAIVGILDLYIPETVEEGEFYIPYFWASGPLVWFLALLPSGVIIETLSKLGYHPGVDVEIIIIPGIFNLIFGSIQWYYLTKLAISMVKALKRM